MEETYYREKLIIKYSFLLQKENKFTRGSLNIHKYNASSQILIILLNFKAS